MFLATVTVIGPVTAFAGTFAIIDVSVQLVIVVAVPPYRKVTVLLLCAAPKPVPVITTEEPTDPEDGDTPVIEIASIKVNCTPVLVTPPTATVTGPLVAVDGTVALMLESLHEVTLAVTLLNLTTLEPWLAPKPEPFNVTDPPMGAAGGDKLEMTGL